MQVDMSNKDIRHVLIKLCDKYSIGLFYESHPDYLVNLTTELDDNATIEELERWLDIEIPLHFVSLGDRPQWIQNPEWPFDPAGNPMVFWGQIDINLNEVENAEDYLHDDGSIYVFMSEEGLRYRPIVIIQQY